MIPVLKAEEEKPTVLVTDIKTLFFEQPIVLVGINITFFLQSKYPVVRHADIPGNQLFGLDLPVVLALIGSLTVLVVGAVVFAVLLKRDMAAKRKMQGLASAADIDAEATRDYQVH